MNLSETRNELKSKIARRRRFKLAKDKRKKRKKRDKLHSQRFKLHSFKVPNEDSDD